VPTLIAKPTRIEAAGNKPKIIQEHIGRVNSKTQTISVARMSSPAGWVEPGQTPEFDEYTLVLSGMLRVEHKGGAVDVQAGGRPSSRTRENGCAIQRRTGPNTWRFACRRSRPIRYIEMRIDGLALKRARRSPDPRVGRRGILQPAEFAEFRPTTSLKMAS